LKKLKKQLEDNQEEEEESPERSVSTSPDRLNKARFNRNFRQNLVSYNSQK